MRVDVTIKGISPLLMNRFTASNEVPVSTFKGDKGDPRTQAHPKAYLDSNGKVYLPGPNIFSCLIAAGTFQKAGKSKLTTMKTSLVPAGLALEEIVCPVLDPDTGKQLDHFEVDSRSVVIPSTGGRIMCHRPMFPNWMIPFSLDVDSGMFDETIVRTLVDDGGKKIGLGDFRPARKGPFGRFVVVKWDVDKEQPASAAA